MSRRLKIALLVTLGVVVLGGGVFAGLTFLASDEKRAATGTPGGGNTGGTDGTEGQAEPLLPDVSPAEMTEQIRQTFATYYQHIVDDDLDAAFALLSARKRNASLREAGLDAWKEAQLALTKFLDPSGLQVEIDYADPKTGVVRVKLSGMTYTNPASSCSTWSGITWVKYEQAAFHYDPGYSTTPQRTRDWKPRVSELLGIGC